ncbi:MAG: hypothetical protein ACFFDN_14785 [Candidatus Hodarchaeota archaeon]
MKIQDIFILKDGLPIYHHKQVDSKLRKTVDDTLITGFLSAITNFTKETGLGIPTFYITESIKFSFFEKSELLFIICSEPSLSNSYIDELFLKLSTSILNQIERQPESLNFPQINSVIKQFLNNLQKKDEFLLQPLKKDHHNESYFREIIPKRHIDDKDNIRHNRRKLFKLINGKNSIYDLAMQMDSHPSKILSILRSYQKEGIISF